MPDWLKLWGGAALVSFSAPGVGILWLLLVGR